jgi:nicotinamide mononucleotide adenylyltransferase
MPRQQQKKVGIFLGRLQPQHPGHETLIKNIFKDSDEVVLCLGSAQKFDKSNPEFARNPLSKSVRLKRLRTFLAVFAPSKPYRIVTALDIAPDSAWPSYLKKCCRLDDAAQNTLYFGDPISKAYAKRLEKVGFKLKLLPRKNFLYKTQSKAHRISSATEIRALEKRLDIDN